MRPSVYSLKTGTLAILVIVLFLALILLDIVMMKMTERDMVNAEIHKATLLVRTMEHDINIPLTTHPYQTIRHLSERNYLSAALITDASGGIIFETKIGRKERNTLLSLARESLQRRKDVTFISSTGWGIFPLRRGELFLASPILHENKFVGVASLQIPLHELYGTIRRTQKIVLAYIVLNTLFFALFGFYLIHRSTIRPINRLMKRAEEFKEGDTFFLASDTKQNEFGRLSRALNLMLRRLEDNKEELRASISSLEGANREIRQAQEDIIRSEKLASVGRLASGVAHEIGNPIGIVLGYLDLLKGNDLKEEERKDFINRIEDEIDRINRTIRNLLDFSRPSKGEVKALSVHELIDDTIEMLKHQPIMSDSEIILDKAAEKDTVQADPDKLKQVFLNLLMNAMDAIEARQATDESFEKMVSIRTRVAPHAGTRGKDSTAVSIEFNDNGPGIPAQDLTKIFDPFYTTKEPGKGTGLGLSVSLRIVQEMGGDITAKSQEGKGTTMILILPIHETGNEQRELS